MLCNILKLFPFYLWALQGRKRWNKDGPLTGSITSSWQRCADIFVHIFHQARSPASFEFYSIVHAEKFPFVFMSIYMPCCCISDLSWIFSATQVNKLIQKTQKVSPEYFTPWKFKNQLLVVLEASFQECTLCLDGAAPSMREYIYSHCGL